MPRNPTPAQRRASAENLKAARARKKYGKSLKTRHGVSRLELSSPKARGNLVYQLALKGYTVPNADPSKAYKKKPQATVASSTTKAKSGKRVNPDKVHGSGTGLTSAYRYLKHEPKNKPVNPKYLVNKRKRGKS